MKRDLEHLDLKQAFHPVPEACRRALMDAARSVREEQPVKRISYRAALIAAVILLAAMAVAYAAVRLGWIEYFSQQYGIAVPRAAQEALETSQPKTCQVGPMTFTYQQLLTDRRIVLSSAAVSLTDGGEALYADDTNVYESISAISDTVASRYSLTDHSMTWLEAAQELELPLYGVRALVELPPESDLGSSMEDALWNEDGTIVYFNMPMLAPGSAAGDVNATLYMAVTQFDPATGEALEKWETREEVTLPVAPLLEEKTYLPQENATFDGLTLESGDGPDLYLLDSNAYDLARVLGSGLVEDLSGNEDIRRGVSQQYEPFQRFVSGEDGAIYGMFERVHGSPMLIDPAAWEAAGLEAAEAPRSYEELLDFAGEWTELVKAGSVGNVRLNTIQFAGYPRDECRYTLWLTGLLWRCWAMRQQEAGEAFRFNTPEFIALADRARELGHALVQVERKPGAASLSLYINGGNVRYGPEDFYTNAFPMRLTADEPVRISAYGFLYIVRKGSPYAQICRELIAGLTCPEDGQPRRCMLFREVAQSQYGTPDFSYNPNGDVLTRKWQEQYRPEWLFFDVEPFFQARQVQRSEGAMYRFAGGGLTAEEFAATLDEICREK